MVIILPFHLLYLFIATGIPPREYLRRLARAITVKFSPSSLLDTRLESTPFPYYHFGTLVTACTVGITVPGMLWFAAVNLSSFVVAFAVLLAADICTVRAM